MSLYFQESVLLPGTPTPACCKQNGVTSGQPLFKNAGLGPAAATQRAPCAPTNSPLQGRVINGQSNNFRVVHEIIFLCEARRGEAPHPDFHRRRDFIYPSTGENPADTCIHSRRRRKLTGTNDWRFPAPNLGKQEAPRRRKDNLADAAQRKGAIHMRPAI